MEYSEEGEPKGFDPEHDISLSDAFALVKQMHPTATSLTVRKFIIGIAIHGNESRICGYAERFEESYVRIDDPEGGIYRGRPEHFASVDPDFWRIGMAITDNPEGSFAANNLHHVTDMTVGELPYRMRDMGNGELQSQKVRLSQFAWGVHFPKEDLIRLANDREWQAWGAVATALQNRGKRGRPPTWKWDEVKASLTIEAARNPAILAKGAGPIVQFINAEMRRRHWEQVPDRKEVDEYIDNFRWLWKTVPEPPN